MRYIRFVVPDIDDSSNVRSGVFHAIFRLRDRGELTKEEETQLRGIVEWFDRNLDRPSRFSRTRNGYHRNTRGISWFKDSSLDHLRQIREIIVILESHNILVEMINSERPGYVVYEDKYQLVAEPFSETRT